MRRKKKPYVSLLQRKGRAGPASLLGEKSKVHREE